MSQEFQALLSNHTWSLVPHSPSQNLVSCKWVFRTKSNTDGSLQRHKAWLVAKGFHQQKGVDYGETFSPVVKPSTIRLMLALSISTGWSVTQLDVQNAFLHGDLKEAVFMQQPLGFIHPDHPNHVCFLTKALYGLKHAPRAWFHRLRHCLLQLGFQPSKSDAISVYLSSFQHTHLCFSVCC